MDDIEKESQSVKQKKIAFAQGEHVEAAILLLRESAKHNPLVGDSEFETVKNAITLDAQSTLIMDFIQAIDAIKAGSLHQT